MQHVTSKLARLLTPLLLAFFMLVRVADAATAQYVQSVAHDGYQASVDGLVLASAVQSDGKVILGGRFNNWVSPVIPSPTNASLPYSLPRVGLARFQVDGTIDYSFNPALNGAVTALAVQGDGSIIVGGEFTVVYYDSSSTSSSKNIVRTHLARINSDGTLDTTFTAGVLATDVLTGSDITFAKDFTIGTIVLQSDGKILIGGRFNQYTDGTTTTAVKNFVRLNADGSLDTTLSFKTNEVIKTILPRYDGSLYIGGGFSTVTAMGSSTATKRLRIAHIKSDGSLDTTFTPQFDNRVNVITTSVEGDLVVGGLFTLVSPPSEGDIQTTDTSITTTKYLRFLVRLNPTTGEISHGYQANINGEVNAIALQKDGRMIIAGNFTNIIYGEEADSYYFGYMARFLPSGAIDATFAPYFSTTVMTVCLQGDAKIIAGGYFTTVRSSSESYGNPANYVARLYTDGSLDSDFIPAKTSAISGIKSLGDGTALLYGSFTNLSGITRAYLAKIDSTGSIDSSFAPIIDGAVNTVYLYTSGSNKGKILIGGSFYTVNNTSIKNMARLNADGSLDTTFTPAKPDGAIDAFEVQDDNKVIIGGEFLSLTVDSTTTTRYYIARLNDDGSIDTGFDPRASGTVRAIKVRSDGRIYVGGSFYSFNPNGGSTTKSRYYLALLLGDGTVDTGFTPSINNEVYTITPIQGDRIIISGNFAGVSATTGSTSNYLYYLAIVNIKGECDANFNPVFNSTVYDVQLLSDSSYIVSGAFTQINSIYYRYIAHIKYDGTVDSSFTPVPDAAVYASAIMPSGKILAVGNFNTVAPSGTNTTALKERSIVSLNTDGSLDTSFALSPSTASAGTVRSLVRMNDGRFLMAGNFTGSSSVATSIGGGDSTNMVRYFPAGDVDTTLSVKANAEVDAISTWALDDKLIGKYAAYSWMKSDGLTYKIDPNSSLDISGTINCVVPLTSGQYLLGGLFNVTVSGTTYYNMIRVNADGSLDTSFVATPDAAVYTIAVQSDGQYVVGGNFTAIKGSNGTSISRYYIARMSNTGVIDTTFNPYADSAIIVIRMQTDGLMVIGGSFTTLYGTGAATDGGNTTSRNYIARLKADGNIDTTFNPDCNGQVNDLLIQGDGKIILGGLFTYLTPNSASSSTARSYIARINSDGTLDGNYYPTANSSVSRIRFVSSSSEKVYVVGSFTTFTPNGASSSTTRHYAARLNTDGTLDDDFAPVFNSTVDSVAVQSDGSVVMAGDFTRVNDSLRTRVVRLSSAGVVQQALVPLVTSTPNDVAVLADGSIFLAAACSKAHFKPALLVGGQFTKIGDNAYPYLARLYIDGVVDPSFAPAPNGAVYTISRLSDGSAVVAGDFTTIAGATATRIAKINADGTLDTTFTASANAAVKVISALSDGRFLIGGSFTTVNGVSRGHIAMLKANGTLDTSFSANADADITGIQVSPTGYVYVCGSFTYCGSSSNAYFTRLKTDGTPATFSSSTALAPNGVVTSIALASDGSFVLAGKFTTIAGSSRSGLARILSDGSLDTLNVATNGQPQAVFLDEDGKLLVAGSFTTLDTLPRFMVGRISVLSAGSQSLTWNADTAVLTWRRSGGLSNIEYGTVEYSNDGLGWNSIGTLTSNSDGSYSLAGVNVNLQDLTLFRVRGPVRSAPYGGQGYVEEIACAYAQSLPTFSLSSTVMMAVGSTLSASTPSSAQNVSISVSGLPTGVTYNSQTNTLSGTPTASGTYTVVWTYSDGFTYRTYTQTWTVYALATTLDGFTASDSQRLNNISSRVDLAASEIAINGLVISGSANKKVLLRAAGPALSKLGVSSPVSQPKLTVYNSSGTVISTVTGWDSSLASEFTRLGAFAFTTGSADAAVELTLAPGSYTVFTTDAAGKAGTVLSEVYDASTSISAESQRLVNLSCRANVTGSSKVLIIGFVVSGASQQRVLLRAVGPGLSGLGVSSYLSDPTLSVYTSDGTLVASNDDWGTQTVVSTSYLPLGSSAVSAAATKTGAFALTSGSKDSSMVLTLAPGVYTFIIRGSSSTASGSALGEVYQIQP